jgi:hypothetical protein
MKKISIVIATYIILIAVLGFANTGCKSVVTTDASGTSITNKVVNSAAVVPNINGVVPIAVQVAISKDSNSIAYFGAAAVILDALVTSGEYNPTNVTSSLSSLKINTPEAQLAVQAGLSIYKAFAADAVTAKLQSSEFLAVLQAFSDAIKQGLMFSSSPVGVGTEIQIKVK